MRRAKPECGPGKFSDWLGGTPARYSACQRNEYCSAEIVRLVITGASSGELIPFLPPSGIPLALARGNRALNRLLDPVACSFRKGRAVSGVERFDREQQPLSAILKQAQERHSLARVPAGRLHDQTQLRADAVPARFGVALLDPVTQLYFFVGC